MKLIVLSESYNYDVGALVRFLIRMFENPKIINIFKENGIEIITSNYIRENIGISELDYIERIDEKEIEDYLIFGIHPYGLNVSIKSKSKIKKIVWINDPHYFAHYVEKNEKSVQTFDENYDPIQLSNIDYLITPSIVYFENLKIEKYNDKIKYFFYFLDEDWYEIIGNIDYKKRQNKIILSGVVGGGYYSRIEFDKLKNEEKFNEIIDKIEHPGYNIGNKSIDETNTGMNYYNKISNYKSAFVGHHNYPIDFLLAKHIEVLMCGCLAFFEPNDLLEKELGLKPFEHYIPCFDENGLIKDPNFYIDWISKGGSIAENGKKYVREKFGNKYILEFIDFLKNVNKKK
jgi:hypothetical protein